MGGPVVCEREKSPGEPAELREVYGSVVSLLKE